MANRLPVEAVAAEDGQSGWRVSPGGLVAALGPVMARNQGTWVGWTGQPDEWVEPFSAEGMRLVPVDLSTDTAAPGVHYRTASHDTHGATAPRLARNAGIERRYGVVSSVIASGLNGAYRRIGVPVRPGRLRHSVHPRPSERGTCDPPRRGDPNASIFEFDVP